MKRLIAIAKNILLLPPFILVCLTSLTDHPDFSGEWELNEAKSELGNSGTQLASVKMKVEQYKDSVNRNYIIQDSILIPVRDKELISAIIVRNKDAEAKLPVILRFTIYPAPSDKRELDNWAAHDYAGVIAYPRGKYLSSGDVEPFEHDAKDVYDVIEWISKQSWCNGKIGMYGGSYLGFSTWASAKNLHPALKTIVPMVAVGPGLDFPKFNGVFSSYMLRWIHRVTKNKTDNFFEFINEKKWDTMFAAWYRSGKSFRALDTMEGRPNKIFQRWLEHPAYDNFWANMIPNKEDFANINIPVLTTTGYFDGDQPAGALHYFTEHYRYNRKANHYLMIGPYDHNGPQGVPRSSLKGYVIDSVARISFNQLAIQWFNYILKDSSNPAILKEKINFQVMGTNTWRHVNTMKEMNNDTLTFYLSSDKTGNYYKLSGKLPASKNDYVTQKIDFTQRESEGNLDWTVIDTNLGRKNYLTFISDVVEEPFAVNGRYYADLKLAINKKDLDVEILLYEMLPDGRYFLISREYQFRTSYMKHPEKRQLLKPGKKESISIRDTYFTSKQISKGSRFVFVLGVPKNQYWQINYGTGKDVSDETIADGKIPLEVKWFSDTWIKIPVYK